MVRDHQDSGGSKLILKLPCKTEMFSLTHGNTEPMTIPKEEGTSGINENFESLCWEHTTKHLELQTEPTICLSVYRSPPVQTVADSADPTLPPTSLLVPPQLLPDLLSISNFLFL